jgi:hypothetical protein
LAEDKTTRTPCSRTAATRLRNARLREQPWERSVKRVQRSRSALLPAPKLRSPSPERTPGGVGAVRPRRAEQVPSVVCLDATPERDAARRYDARSYARLRGHIPQAGPCSALRRAGQNRPVPPMRLEIIGLRQVRRLRRRGRWNTEQGPRWRGCDRATGHEHVVTGFTHVFAVRSQRVPLPRYDVPCKGSYLSCLARLAAIRTWRNARRGTCSELP